MSELQPTAKGDNGLSACNAQAGSPETYRDAQGRFVPGNPGGPGNPNARSVAQFRQAILDAVSPEDITDVVRGLVAAARAGESWAVKELLDRCVGRPQQGITLDAYGGGPRKTYINVDISRVTGVVEAADPAKALSGAADGPN